MIARGNNRQRIFADDHDRSRFLELLDRYGWRHLFQARYTSILVAKDSHLLRVCRYVVRNRVRAGLCKTPEDWPWSSYRATAGLTPTQSWLTTDEILRMDPVSDTLSCQVRSRTIS